MEPSLIRAVYAQYRYEDQFARPRRRRERKPRTALTLFACLFATQAAAIAIGPVLPSVAHDLGVSVAAAGQLRTVLGLSAGLAALSLNWIARTRSLRSLLFASSAAIAAGSLASALASTFLVLALAQVVIGAGVGIGVAAGSAAAAEWVRPELRSRVLSWALLGQPMAWIVGMPLVGLLGGRNWRLAWIVFPLAAAAAAAAGLSAQPSTGTRQAHSLRSTLTDPIVAAWLTGEVLANAGWIATVVYTGALCEESYGTSAVATGVILALGASAFAAGTVGFRRLADGDVRAKLVLFPAPLAASVLVLAAVRPSVAVTTTIFAVAAFIGGGRTLLGNAAGLELAPERRVAATSLRTAANNLGTFLGTGIAGAALAAYGWDAFGISTAALILAAPLPLLAAARRVPEAVPATA